MESTDASGSSFPSTSRDGQYPQRRNNDNGVLTKILTICQDIYHDHFKWELFKSVAMFLIGVKLSRECYDIRIPVRYYEPFDWN